MATVEKMPMLQEGYEKLSQDLRRLKEERPQVVEAIEEFPLMNASLAEDEIVVHDDIDMGIAVALDYEGLIVPVIKVVRNATGRGLTAAKAVADAAPGPVKEGVERDEGEKLKAELEEAGATVEVN